jgi:hypothetical protein
MVCCGRTSRHLLFLCDAGAGAGVKFLAAISLQVPLCASPHRHQSVWARHTPLCVNAPVHAVMPFFAIRGVLCTMPMQPHEHHLHGRCAACDVHTATVIVGIILYPCGTCSHRSNTCNNRQQCIFALLSMTPVLMPVPHSCTALKQRHAPLS